MTTRKLMNGSHLSPPWADAKLIRAGMKMLPGGILSITDWCDTNVPFKFRKKIFDLTAPLIWKMLRAEKISSDDRGLNVLAQNIEHWIKEAIRTGELDTK